MSLDYRLFFVYHISMMAMMIAGMALSIRQELAVTLTLVMVLATISIRHRQQNNWLWPGVSRKDIFAAIGTVAAITFFLFAATPIVSPLRPQTLPWFLAGAGIGTFGVLSALKIVAASKEELLMECRVTNASGQEVPVFSALPVPVEARWKKITRGVFSACFLLIWVSGVLSFYMYGKAMQNGSEQPTATHTEPLSDHGRTIYITPAEKERIDRLQSMTWLFIPVVIGGLVLHFIVGVKLFGDTPTLPEYLKRKSLP